MAEPKTPEASKSFKSVCLVEDSPDGKGLQVTAFGKDGKALATGTDFVERGSIMGNFIDNMQELLSVGGRATGDSVALNRNEGARYKEGGIALNVAKGLCDVTTVDRGGVTEGTMRMGVVLKNPAFEVTR